MQIFAENRLSSFPTLAAIAIVLRKDKVLLVRRKNEPDAGLWGFPGGHVEPGETALNAATRELLEETSIVANPNTYLTNVDVIEHDIQGDITFHFLLAAVMCTYISGTPIAGDDVSDVCWFAIDEILENQIQLSKHVNGIIHLAVILNENNYSSSG